MSYFNDISIHSSDSPSVDAFGRWRVSNLTTLYDNKQLYDTGSLVWATKIIGNATASFIPNNASVKLITSSSNSSVIRQTRKHHVYQPGKSHLIVMTGNFNNATANTIKRLGVFDQNNGLYFMSSGSSFGVGIRTDTSGTPTDTFYSQSSWNLDHYDGTGKSGNYLNLSASQIFFFDFEWLGVGRVRYGIYQNGIPVYCHQINNTNTLNTVYMSTPNNPIRVEIISSDSTPQSIIHICSAVSSEGGLDVNGSIRGISNPNALTIGATSYVGMAAIRLKSSSLDSTILPIEVDSAQTFGSSVYELSLLLDPSGSLNWNWQNLSNSNIQYATASSVSTSIAIEGTKIFSVVNAGSSTNNNINYDPTFALGSDIDGNQNVLVVGWRGISGNSANSSVSLMWREL